MATLIFVLCLAYFIQIIIVLLFLDDNRFVTKKEFLIALIPFTFLIKGLIKAIKNITESYNNLS